MRTLTQFLIWVVIFLILLISYTYRFEIKAGGLRMAANLFPGHIFLDDGKIMISRSQDGHFYVNAVINGAEVKFVIDTGATGIALSKRDAQKIGFSAQKLNFTSPVHTAGGVVYSAPVLLNSLSIGPKRFNNVRAHVNSSGLDISLLGMSIISRFDSFNIAGDMLVLDY